MTGIIGIILIIAVLGFAMYLLTTYVKIPQPFMSIIWFLVIIGMIVLLLNAFGISTGIRSPKL